MNDQATAWDRFVEIYTPLIFYWARQRGLLEADAADLVQDVLLTVYRKIHQYRRRSSEVTGSFRAWLRAITINRLNALARKSKLLPNRPGQEQLEQLPDRASLESSWDAGYQVELILRAVQTMKKHFAAATWEALWESLSGREDLRTIALRHGISRWTLYAARKRLFDMVRRDLDGLLD